MKRMAKVLVVLVLALALCQSAMAAPTQTGYRATTYGNHNGFMKNLSWLFGAIWGGGGSHGAIWGGGGSHGAIWGGTGGH